ncbi:tape measure protein, partial [Enterobacter hormaechei]
MVISGSSAAAAEGALIQLGQAFASGTLRGEELNSVLEGAPALAQAIARGLNVPIGKLRELGQAGQLSADQVVKALQNQAAAVDND